MNECKLKYRFIFFVCVAFAMPVLAVSENSSKAVSKSVVAYTPVKGSSDRKGIMGALRIRVKNMSSLDVIFVVTHLKVKDNWAWAEVEPQSKDGARHYEPLTGLLHKKDGYWRYIEGLPEWAICEEDPDCSEPSRYFKKLSKKHPGLSMDIFPK